VSAEQGPRLSGGDATAANGLASRQRDPQTITDGTGGEGVTMNTEGAAQ